MSDKKKINEMSSASGGSSQGGAGNFFRVRRNRRSKNSSAPFGPAGFGVVFPKNKSKSKSKDMKKHKNGKYVSAETKSESILRESIRNLIFLNRVKFHEEQALREMQEQKLRKVIRYLINEEDDAVAKSLDTTGQTSAYEWLQKIETTTFKNNFLSLVTSRRQRRAFKKVYLTGVKIYLDSLDEKYFILNPEKRPGGVPQIGGQAINPAAAGALTEQEQVNPAAETVANVTKASNDSMQDQAIKSAVDAAGLSDIQDAEDINQAIKKAQECLKQDLAQLDDLYFDLSLTNFSTQKGRQTSDRKDFRMFLIGDKNTIGNLQVNFKRFNKDKPITNKFPNDIPDEDQDDTPILDVPKTETSFDTATDQTVAPTATEPPPDLGGGGEEPV